MIKTHLIMDIDKKVNIDKQWINKTCKKIFIDNGKKFADVSFIITTDNKVNELKKRFFNEDILTDVISFNLEEEGDPIEGEIYISLDRIIDNAKIFNQEILMELKRIIIHGLLHLIGYSDESKKEKSRMTKLENYYIK
tara:strand:- start:628 stop:1041 length:414 start_codon:yes stop_codon:yes gene_type:complete